MIPKRIHFVWIGPEMPEWAQRNVEEFRRLNPNHSIEIHGREALHPDYEPIFDSLAERCSQADLIRLSVLEQFGGWYFDTDYWPLRPVDDAERAWDLDGSKLFVAECWTDRSNPGWLGNGVLAGSQNCTAWSRLRQSALAANPKSGRLAYGPALIKDFHFRHPNDVIIAGDAWFNGIKAPTSTTIYHAVVNGGRRDVLRRIRVETGGQLPYAMHLWAWKYGDQLGQPKRGKTAAVVCLTNDVPAKTSVFTAVGEGLRSCGFNVEVLPYQSNALSTSGLVPDLVVLWNGLKNAGKSVTDEALRLGIPVLRIEYGWLDRAKNFQLDHEGILHNASWRNHVSEPASAESFDKLRRLVPNIEPMRSRHDGYVLVIGQVSGDSQMFNSEIIGRLPLQRLVVSAMNNGTKAFFRPHPQESNRFHNDLLPRLPGPENISESYNRTMHGVGLADALAGARFVVTINSNTITEALIAGVPCLAFGPSLAINAGAAHPTTVKTFKHDFQEMLEGWCPSQYSVENYLAWLAGHQWNRGELARADVLRPLIQAAGVAL